MEEEVELPAFLMEVFHTNKKDGDDQLSEDVEEEEKCQRKRVMRTAMGEYIVEPGGQPLTSQGIPGPGPANYLPKIGFTRTEPPHYTVASKWKVVKPKRMPGPSDYDTRGNLKWKAKKISLKGRSKAQSDEEIAKAASDIGPARYNVKVDEVGKTGFKYSMGGRTKFQGLKSTLIQSSDVVGFNSPGPAYRPSSAHWGKGQMKTFGNSRKTTVSDSNKAPGPADYTLTSSQKGPAYSLAKRVKVKAGTDFTPAPNAYDVGSTIGKAVAMSMTARREDVLASKFGPSPNSYTLQSSLTDKKNAKSLAYKWFERNDEYHPGPGDYDVHPEKVQERSPAYSCRLRTEATGPVASDSSPGPANYSMVSKFSKNDKPAYSFGHRGKLWDTKDDIPGPNSYYLHRLTKEGAAKAPAYSIGKRLKRADISEIGPGPAAYKPGAPRASTGYTMTKRIKNLKGYTNPAPNAYDLQAQQTQKGVPTKMGIALKSRASPWVYSGFKTNRFSEPTVDIA